MFSCLSGVRYLVKSEKKGKGMRKSNGIDANNGFCGLRLHNIVQFAIQDGGQGDKD